MKKFLVSTVGLPRSGKTTWVSGAKLKYWAAVVNPDSIRLALHGKKFYKPLEGLVWVIARIMVKALFLAGHEVVILDVTNTKRHYRDMWISDDWTLVFKEFDTSKEECIRRALARSDESDVKIVEVIERMAEEFEPLEEDETQLSEVVQLILLPHNLE